MPPKIFISYSQQDTDFKDELLTMLKGLQRQGRIAAWHDRDIEAGSDWLPEIEQAIETCQVALLLISADFIASDFIHSKEMKRFLTRRKTEKLLVLPIFLRDCLWEYEEGLKDLKGLNNPKQPLSTFKNNDRDKVWTDIAKKLIDSIKSLETNSEVLDFKQHLKKLKQAAAQKADELDDVFDEIRAYLKHLESKGNFDDEEHFQTLESFLLDKSDAIDLDDFIEFCQQNLDQSRAPKKVDAGIDYQSFLKRLKNGEVTLFLGMQMDSDYSPQRVAQKLTQLETINGLAEACEHIELKDSRKALIKGLSKQLHSDNVSSDLYELLSTIKEPLLIISVHYNDGLEKSFRNNQKKYVKVFQNWQREGFSIIQAKSLILEYSDREKVETCTPEELSGKRLLDSGYSLIYKLRGCLKSQYNQEHEGDEPFILSESEHFDFSRLIKIPDYVISKLRNNYLWFLGHHLQSWEERMLVRIVLNRVFPKSPIAIQENASEYSQTYWRAITRVEPYSMSLQDFINGLRKYL
jgi:hypothetical protein